MDKTHTAVRIAGQEFKLSSSDSEEYVQRLAVYLNRGIDEVQHSYPSLSTANCVILAALNLCDEYLKLKDKYAELAATTASDAGISAPEMTAPVKRPFERNKTVKA